MTALQAGNRTGLRLLLSFVIVGTLPFYIIGIGLWLFAPDNNAPSGGETIITGEPNAEATWTPLGGNVTRTSTPTSTPTIIRTPTQFSPLQPTPGQFIPPATPPPTRFATVPVDTLAPTLTQDIRDDDQDGVFNVNDRCPDNSGPANNGGCPVDSDGDGLMDETDNCPAQSGPASNSGCPLPVDSDADGVPDNQDACPAQAGIPANNGCPPPVDSDGDGVLDNIDACPAQSGIPLLNGCPEPDNDGDGFPDGSDSCPGQAGIAPDGCPAPAPPAGGSGT